MQSYQTLATFTYPYEYAVLKLLLEQADIRFFFANETVIGLAPFYSHALGGIFLKVHPEDFQTATEIFEQFKDNRLHIV